MLTLYPALSLLGTVWLVYDTLPDTQPLTMQGDPAAQMVNGMGRFFLQETSSAFDSRERHWNRDFTSHESYRDAVRPNRRRFKELIGVVDPRETVDLHFSHTASQSSLVGEGDTYQVYAVRWNTLRGVDAEGVLLQPKGGVVANIVALPDCDWTPEMLVGLDDGLPENAQFARRLAESGCRVLVPMLINRADTFSGNPDVRMTNQPHREFIYRAAYELGRHIIGYEVQKALAAVDWFTSIEPNVQTGIIGYGEGGLIAFYAAAVDARIAAACVSGYFQPRENLWQEPIYRNVWGLLREFGDAEIASLIAPRALVVEESPFPEVSGPPAAASGRSNVAAPGEIRAPSMEAVEQEFERAQRLIAPLKPAARFTLTRSEGPGGDEALSAFLAALAVENRPQPNTQPPKRLHQIQDSTPRLERQFNQLVEHTQRVMRDSEFRRKAFWSKADASSVEAWEETSQWYREYLWDEVIGRSPEPDMPMNPRSRRIYETASFVGYEVVLDVYPDVTAYGILLVPKNIQEGERRPVVVCQHGLEGRPQDLANPEVDHDAYHQYACKLAERGFVTYAPQNPYIGGNTFRQLVRMGHPLKQSLYSVIVRQHQRTLEWLGGLSFVDAARIAFYGLSYGGKTAMRIPALLKGYCLSICSADFNEWIWKNVSVYHTYSYMFTGEYDMYEFNLGNTFNYAELSGLICPRPFMVERGHHDGVAPDEWVAYEYAKTRRRYDLLGIGERTEMEVFTGPHTIHGVGTFAFLHRHLNWPEPD